MFRRKSLIEKGLVRMKDLYNFRRSAWYTPQQIAEKYDIHPVSALALSNRIPTPWKDKVLQRGRIRCTNGPLFAFADFCSSASVARWAYRKLQPKPCNPDKCQSKWCRDLNLPNNDIWPQIFLSPFRITDDIALRWLQYRIIHRILPTNKRLYIFGITQSNACQHCVTTEESIVHLFWSCPVVQRFWHSLNNLYASVQIDKTAVILGLPTNTSTSLPSQSIQLLILIAKQHIWYCRARKAKPTAEGVVNRLFKTWKMEKYVHKIEGKTEKCDKVWHPLINPLIHLAP